MSMKGTGRRSTGRLDTHPVVLHQDGTSLAPKTSQGRQTSNRWSAKVVTRRPSVLSDSTLFDLTDRLADVGGGLVLLIGDLL